MTARTSGLAIVDRLRTALAPPERSESPARAEPLQAGEILAPRGAWPLTYVADITGWTMDRATRVVSFTLTHGASYTNEAATFTARVPFADGDLFDKRGAYLVVIVPAEGRDQVRRILRAARGEVSR